ncbi:MAG: fatty acid desaturase [Porticoccaceae bacterium]
MAKFSPVAGLATAKVNDDSASHQCTSNRVGMEWLLTPLSLSQNYHLVHHLYPTVPFYRYLKIWDARKHYHQSQYPATTHGFSLSPRSDRDLMTRP